MLENMEDMTVTCIICYDRVEPMTDQSVLHIPCCSKNAWFHRDCMQKLALSAGHLFRCPLCNNKGAFVHAMLMSGIYVSTEQASWEREPNAFQELLHQYNQCDAKHCLCPEGRFHAVDGTNWKIVLCQYCGSQGIHVLCGKLNWSDLQWGCENCTQMLQNSAMQKQ